MTEAAGAPTGDAAALDGAYGLAAVALDWLHDAELRRARWARGADARFRERCQKTAKTATGKDKAAAAQAARNP